MIDRKNFTLTATSWSYYPYQPPFMDRGEIYVSRIVPDVHRIQADWQVADAQEVVVYWRKRGEGEFLMTETFTGGKAFLENLDSEVDYEFYLQAPDGRKSLIRLARTGDYLETPVQYLHPEDEYYIESGRYLGSPCIVRQPDGSLLATMDFFAPAGNPKNLSTVYRSDDNGKTWDWQCELFPCLWGKPFVHRGEVYMLSVRSCHGDILLGKTTDGGRSFVEPAVLARAPGIDVRHGIDMSPEPPVEYGGRIWINFHWGGWKNGECSFQPFVASAPADSDLMDNRNWTISAPCIYDENWPGVAKGKSGGTLEGTFVVFPDGELYMVARYQIVNCEPDHGLAMVYKVRTDDPSAPLEYARTIPFAGNHSKFTILKDEQSGYYYTIMTRIRGSEHKRDRNLLTLARSKDCVEWENVKDIFDFTDKDPQKHGVQYVDFFIEGEDLYYICRTAINGANDYHNSNVMLFSIIKDFRNIGHS